MKKSINIRIIPDDFDKEITLSFITQKVYSYISKYFNQRDEYSSKEIILRDSKHTMEAVVYLIYHQNELILQLVLLKGVSLIREKEILEFNYEKRFTS